MTAVLKRVPILGVSLILVGTTMLLQRIDVISLEWQTIAWGLLALFAASRAVTGFSDRRSGTIFWGSMVFLVAAYRMLARLGILYIEPYLLFPTLISAVGVSLFVMYCSRPKDWHVMTAALVFVGLGFVMIMTELGYFYRWDVIPLVNTYWPVALILFGASLLLRHRSAQ